MAPQESLELLCELTEAQRKLAWERYAIIKPHIEEGVALAHIAKDAKISVKTVQRWKKRFTEKGLIGLCRTIRKDSGSTKFTESVQSLVRGFALKKPRMSTASIHRNVAKWCKQKGVTAPSYGTVYELVRCIDPALAMLAHEGTKEYSQHYELLHRRDASRSNEIWQADHTLLDIVILNEKDHPERPWLTVVIDDYSRAISGYYLYFGSPSAQQTALAFRQAIWRKEHLEWHVSGIPEVFYTDHGSDFTSIHIEQVCLDLKIELIFSTVGKPRGRGKIERFFRTLNQLFLCELSGFIADGSRRPEPALTLAELDTRLRAFIVEYNLTEHSQTKVSPQTRWHNNAFLPQMPASVTELDLLLLTLKDTRRVQRDGIRFQGLRYTDPLLAGYIGEDVMLRYDPRDMAEIQVYHKNTFLCRAICPELSSSMVSLKEIQTARSQRRKELRKEMDERLSLVDALIGKREQPKKPPEVVQPELPRPSTKLKRYENE